LSRNNLELFLTLILASASRARCARGPPATWPTRGGSSTRRSRRHQCRRSTWPRW
jgi:hypothetical protein